MASRAYKEYGCLKKTKDTLTPLKTESCIILFLFLSFCILHCLLITGLLVNDALYAMFLNYKKPVQKKNTLAKFIEVYVWIYVV